MCFLNKIVAYFSMNLSHVGVSGVSQSCDYGDSSCFFFVLAADHVFLLLGFGHQQPNMTQQWDRCFFMFCF